MIPGFAAPENSDEREFPYSAAAVIAHWSVAANHPRSLEVVKEVQDSRGNPAVVKDLAGKWEPEASKRILNAREGMLSARDDVKAYWEGSGFSAFNSYVEHVLKVMDDTAEVMRSMSKLNLDIRETMVNQYPDPVAAAKENLDEMRRSSGLRRPLDLGQEGVSWNAPAMGIQEAGGAAAFRDVNLVVHVSVEGTDYGPDRKSQPLDPAKAEQDAIRILRAIKESL